VNNILQQGRDLPLPSSTIRQNTEAEAFWQQISATSQLTALQILDDMVSTNFTAKQQDDIPVPVLVWYFWQRCCNLVQVEKQMGAGVHRRHMQSAGQLAMELAQAIEWLATAHNSQTRVMAIERDGLQELHRDLVAALENRPYYVSMADQSYGGLLPAPKRIQLIA
jgi:hypothetical protein